MQKPEVPMSDRDEKGRFLTGAGGPGRKPGSRNKLSEAFLSALNADFELHGPDVITKVRTEKPDVYLKVVANLMPARLEAQLEAKVDVGIGFNSSVEEVLELVAREAGHEAAMTLAAMFGVELTTGMTLLPPRRPSRSYHPSSCYNSEGQPVYCKCDEPIEAESERRDAEFFDN